MTTKFRNKYRIESSRLQNWNYAWNAGYYVTVCTKNMECYFGEIIKGQMNLSEIGEIVKSEWLKSPEIRPDMNLELDEYVIMPNHIHGIIIIGRNKYNVDDRETENCRRDAMHGVSTSGLTETPGIPVELFTLETSENKSGPQRKNLSSIIRGFKSIVTKHARKIHPDFAWQTRFFDHVIRNNESYNKIRYYIWDNPKKWSTDRLNPDNKEP